MGDSILYKEYYLTRFNHKNKHYSYGVSQTEEYLFGGHHKKDYSILGSPRVWETTISGRVSPQLLHNRAVGDTEVNEAMEEDTKPRSPTSPATTPVPVDQPEAPQPQPVLHLRARVESPTESAPPESSSLSPSTETEAKKPETPGPETEAKKLETPGPSSEAKKPDASGPASEAKKPDTSGPASEAEKPDASADAAMSP